MIYVTDILKAGFTSDLLAYSGVSPVRSFIHQIRSFSVVGMEKHVSWLSSLAVVHRDTSIFLNNQKFTVVCLYIF